MTRVHKSLLAVVAAALLAAAFSAVPTIAQTPAASDPKLIKVVNLVDVFNKMDMKIEGDNEIRDLGAKLEEDRKKLEDDLASLKKLSASYNEKSDEFRQTEEKMLRKVSEIAAQSDFVERRLLMEQRLKTIQIYRTLLKGVDDYAKANGIALVLMTDTPDLLGARSQQELLSKISLKKVIYAHESMDITKALVVKLNTEYQQDKSKKPANP